MEPLATIETKRVFLQESGSLEIAVDILRRGGVIAFPTDTVYGVGAHAFLPEAVAQIYTVKERPAHMPVPILLPNADALLSVCTDIPAEAWRLSERFWPGGLSMVLRRSPAVPDVVVAGGRTVAVRVPDHTLILKLCERLVAPLAATSANRHGEPAPVTPEEVERRLGGRIGLILDGGSCHGGVPSTVLDLTVRPPKILRQGPITAEQLTRWVSEHFD
jgi:L-threonylcarbamoyladenylate synthase